MHPLPDPARGEACLTDIETVPASTRTDTLPRPIQS